MPLAFLAALAVPPAAVLARNRFAAHTVRALVITAPVTWFITTLAVSWMLSDPSDISTAFFFLFLVAPCLGVPLTAVIATRAVGIRGQVASAVILAFLGWVAGLVALWLVSLVSELRAAGLPDHFWEGALILALPTCYATCGAVVAAGLGGQRPSR